MPCPLPQLSPEQSTLAWIQYQRFSRRAESLQASRKVFMRARKAPGSLWHVFVASALMEWHAAKNETVRTHPLQVLECIGYRVYTLYPSVAVAGVYRVYTLYPSVAGAGVRRVLLVGADQTPEGGMSSSPSAAIPEMPNGWGSRAWELLVRIRAYDEGPLSGPRMPRTRVLHRRVPSCVLYPLDL